jgi:heparan-alpha-glucosaminide N-acetyltransferase
MTPYNKLPYERIHAIDVLRGLTILLMIFVNEVAGVPNIPQWLKHMPRGADGMMIADWVFAGFLFIVGMSIPLALNYRIQKGDSFWQLQKHIVIRALCLLVLGFFMVNAEGGYNEEAMGMSISLWSLLFFIAAILIWNVHTFENKVWTYLLRAIGIAGLVILALIYRSGEDGTEYMHPRWWGILGLIGWAYLYACIVYQVTRGNKYYLALAVVLCTLFYIAGKTSISETYWILSWTRGQSFTQTAIVLCGIILTLIFFDQKKERSLRSRLNEALGFAAILLIAGMLLRPYFKLAKLGATPSWVFYSSVYAILAFIILYWITDLKKKTGWTQFLQPAASNPLLTYIIPFILWALYAYFDFYPLPDEYRTGITGVLFCIVYAFVIVWIARGLNKLKIRLQL